MKKRKKIISFVVSILVLVSMAGCGSNNTNNQTENSKNTAFLEFKGTDFDGNEVDNSLFSNNAVTVVNFWFNGCSPCVEELPTLNALNEELRKQGAELIGINADAGLSDELLKEAKDILAKQGATYRNIYYASGSKLENFANQLEGFPTTFLVDRSGNIIGETILGSIDDDESQKEIKQRIDKIIAEDKSK